MKPTFGTQTVGDQTYTAGDDIGTVTLPSASSGDSPLAYSLSPALPKGLSFNASTRTIAGTPTASQAARRYTYSVRDTDGDRATLTFSITVAPDLTPTFGTQTVSDQTYIVSRDIGTVPLPAASGGDGTLRYSLSPDLSNGLSFNSRHPDHHRNAHGPRGRKAVHLHGAGTLTATARR